MNYRVKTLTYIAANQPHRTRKWEDTSEEPKWHSKKSIHYITNFHYPSNSRCTCKKPGGNNIICRLLPGLEVHTRRKDGASTTRLRATQSDRRMLYKITKVKVSSSDGNTDYINIVAGVLQGDTLAQYLFIICLGGLLIKWKTTVSSWQRKEAEDTPQKQLWTRTTPRTLHFWQTHPLKPKPCHIVWNEQLLA